MQLLKRCRNTINIYNKNGFSRINKEEVCYHSNLFYIIPRYFITVKQKLSYVINTEHIRLFQLNLSTFVQT